MRLRVHSTRLAVSLLLGAFCSLPWAKTVLASTSSNSNLNISLTSSPISSIVSKYDPCVTPASFRPSLMTLGLPSRFEPVTQNGDTLIISESKNGILNSLKPSKTVLKKADQDSQELVITPSPSPVIAIPLITPSAGSSATQQSTGSVLNSETLFSMVNAYRVQVGLAPFEKSAAICAITASRAPELDNEVWGSSYMHAGFKARSLPYWATENMISMRTEAEALNWWLNSPVHRGAILGSAKYACVACAGKSCAMIFSNLEEKNQTPVASLAAVLK